jgi:hypothetical protein
VTVSFPTSRISEFVVQLRGGIVPSVTLPHKPELNADRMFDAFHAKFGETYEVYKTALMGADLVVKKSGSTGVSVKLVQKTDKTIIRYGGMAPSAMVRILLAGIIPYLILAATKWKALQREVGEFIENAPEFK